MKPITERLRDLAAELHLPIGHEAADKIEALEREIEWLKACLRRIGMRI